MKLRLTRLLSILRLALWIELRLETEVGEGEEEVGSGMGLVVGEEREGGMKVAVGEVGELEEVVGGLEPHILLAGLKARS